MPDPAPVLASSINWGDVPSWLSAFVTLAAFVFAAVAVVVARRTYQLESERDRINAESRRDQDAFVRRSQAALISAWWARGGHHKHGHNSWAVHLRNASDAPVYKASMTIHRTGSHPRRKTIDLQVVPPAQEPAVYPITISGLTADGEHDDNGHALGDYRVSLRFTDAAGVRWIRDEYGYLRELEPNLLIWTSPEGGVVVEPFTAEFLATYGVTAECDTALIEAELERHFIETTPGPDILIGPHDWLGSLAKRELVEPITLSDERRGLFSAAHLNAFSLEGELYAVPSSLDTVALIRNTDLVSDAPQSIEELLDIARTLRSRGVVSELLTVPVGAGGDPFHMWPMFTSAGGWLFGRKDDGTWDAARQGIGSPESVAAFEKIRMLGELGVLKPNVERLDSFDVFMRRQSAFLLAASGAVVPIRESGINFAVSAVPPYQGLSPGAPFLSVNGFYVASQGRNKVVASDLVSDYLTRTDVAEAFGRLACVIPLRMTDECDPAIVEFHRLCAYASPIPAFPQMRDIWSSLAAAEMAVIAGGDPASAAARLAERFRALF